LFQNPFFVFCCNLIPDFLTVNNLKRQNHKPLYQKFAKNKKKLLSEEQDLVGMNRGAPIFPLTFFTPG